MCVPFQNLIGHYIAYSHIARERQREGEGVSERGRFLCAGQAKSMLNHISNCAKAKGEWEKGNGNLLLLLLPQQTVMAMLHCLAPAAEQSHQVGHYLW